MNDPYHHSYYAKQNIKVVKTVPTAEIPHKEKPTDAMWNVTLISRGDNRVSDEIGQMNIFDTGLKIVPPPGYYIELIANNDLWKQGYMLSSPIVINPDDKDIIQIPLYKFRESDDIDLPYKAIFLFLRKIDLAYLANVLSLEETNTRKEEVNAFTPTPAYSNSKTTSSNKKSSSKKGKNHYF